MLLSETDTLLGKSFFVFSVTRPIMSSFLNGDPSWSLSIEQRTRSFAPRLVPSQQAILNGEVHNWYRIVHGYSDHLVKKLLDQFEIQPGQTVIDAFCGSGTTLVECMKHGINAIGIDANPSSCFAARVKTNWKLRSYRLLELLDEVGVKQRRALRYEHLSDATYQYLESSGMLTRGWISPEPLRKAIAIKVSIAKLGTSPAYKNALLLALISEVINSSSNIKFGPELYCAKRKDDADVFAGFKARVKTLAADLDKVACLEPGKVTVYHGDSRDCFEVANTRSDSLFAAGICSPPYPSEHDYTRNARLELAFLEEVSDRETLRAIKRLMIRSHTKNIYKGDADEELVRDHSQITAIYKSLEEKTKDCTHGFGKLYPRVVVEYFGGMKRHFKSMKKLLAHGALCAYVVGDQSSYAQVPIPTAEILSTLAFEIGFETVKIEKWRTRWSTSTSKGVQENILILRNPK